MQTQKLFAKKKGLRALERSRPHLNLAWGWSCIRIVWRGVQRSSYSRELTGNTYRRLPVFDCFQRPHGSTVAI